ncbi:MAG: FKBP-type peptidyl-prolyl cis-trans isomerase [Bacteroidota bacterium]
MKKYLFILSVLVMGLASCTKNNTITLPVVDPAVQAKADDDAIVAYLAAHTTITATKDATSGLYYQVLEPGTGAAITANSTLVVNYASKNIKDVQIEANDNVSFKLSTLIPGWQIGLPKIKNGGKILLIIPSGLAYGPYGNGTIPPNAVIIFTITVKSVDGVTPVVD